MTGYKYAISVAQLEDHGLLHPDEHIFFMKIQEEQPYTIRENITQLSLKSGLKEWGTKYHNDLHSNIKQLNLRDTFKPMNCKELEKKSKEECIIISHGNQEKEIR